ncbi:MAG: DUF3347 domain-containing protein [Cytophagales bacterium]
MKTSAYILLAMLLTQQNLLFSKNNVLENDTIQHVFETYFSLKNSLVDSDPEKATFCAQNLTLALERFQHNDNSSKSSLHVLKIKNVAQQIEKTKDLDEQRRLFEIISNHLIVFAKQIKSKPEKIFLQFCPMAFNDKGAYWLSERREVRNPYFGNAMLKCGTSKSLF